MPTRVRKQFGMAVSRGARSSPSFSRLVHQKGIDLSIAAAESIVAEGGQLVVIGQGEGRFEEALRDLAGRHPTMSASMWAFRETEARRIFAGSDFLLMPSRFEPQRDWRRCMPSASAPCRSCAAPAANDTVEDGVSGFTFADASPRGLTSAITRAFATFGQKKRLQRHAAHGDVARVRLGPGGAQQLRPLRPRLRQQRGPGVGKAA